ncbi:MAG: branched-chain amino acid transaminase [Thermoplasmata archaeon]|nr:branched-chain amino acid transaminase [Thermoplasmata archaeon]
MKDLKVWLDGELIQYNDAKVPILTHSLQYGSGIFEGIRAYETDNGTAIFRLDDHINRFFRSAKIYYMDLKYTKDEIKNAIIEVVKKNNLSNCYIRPFAFYNDDTIGLSPFKKKISVFIAAVPFKEYLTELNGVKCKISSWKRINSNILPVSAKASGNYLNSIIAHLEARYSGYDEAILLTDNGSVAEGPGENIFIVKGNNVISPGLSSDILEGITRDTVMNISKDLGYNFIERDIHKEELYVSNEVFFSGTAAEITPIVNIDGIRIGDGNPGKITVSIKNRYMDIVHGKERSHNNWLTYI